MELITFILESMWFKVFLATIPLVGLIGIIVNIRYSQRNRNANKYIMELAEKNLKKDISEKELKNKKEEIEVYASKIDELKLQIKKDIPKEARKVVLLGQLHSQVSHLHKLKNEVEKIRTELSTLGEQTELDGSLLKFLEKEIKPEYIIRDKRETLKTMLTMSTTATAIAYVAIPYEIRLFISVPLISFSAYVLFQLLKTYWRGFAAIKALIKRKAILICVLIGIPSLLLSIFFAILSSSLDDYNYRDVSSIAALVFGVLTFGCLVIAINLIMIRRKNVVQPS